MVCPYDKKHIIPVSGLDKHLKKCKSIKNKPWIVLKKITWYCISYLWSYCKQQINYLLCQLADRRPTRQSQSPPNLRILKLTQQLTKQLNNIRSSRQLSCLDLRKQLMSQFNKEDINQGGKWTLQKRKGDQTREADIKKQKWTWTEDLHNDYKYILNLLNLIILNAVLSLWCSFSPK